MKTLFLLWKSGLRWNRGGRKQPPDPVRPRPPPLSACCPLLRCAGSPADGRSLGAPPAAAPSSAVPDLPTGGRSRGAPHVAAPPPPCRICPPVTAPWEPRRIRSPSRRRARWKSFPSDSSTPASPPCPAEDNT
jgi:hypothetical protein